MAYYPLTRKADTPIDLRSVAGTIGSQIQVFGLASAADNKGVIFRWDSTSTATDDGVSTIQVTGVTTGRWLAMDNLDRPITGFSKLMGAITAGTDGIRTTLRKLWWYVTGFNGYHLNDFAGIDPTGATDCGAAIQSALTAAGANAYILASGIYHSTVDITLVSGQILESKRASWFLDGNTANISLFKLSDNCHLIGCKRSSMQRGTGVSSFSGVYVSAKAGWSIRGWGSITTFGNQGIRISGSPSSPDGYSNGIIDDVWFTGLLNNGSGGTNGNGHGIKLENAAEYVTIRNCWIRQNQGFGILNDQCGNNPIIGCKVMKNTLGGIRIIGNTSTGNSDHNHITGCTVNHNDIGTTYNFWFSDIRYGVNISGGSSIGGVLIKAENCTGIIFDGCGLGIGGAMYIDKGASGDDVWVKGGYQMTATRQAAKLAVIGASNIGTIVFDSKQSIPTRSIGSNYTISTVKNARVYYKVRIAYSVTAVLASVGSVKLRYSTDAGSTWIEVSEVGISIDAGLVISGYDDLILSGEIPAGALVLITKAETNTTITIGTTQTEVLS